MKEYSFTPKRTNWIPPVVALCILFALVISVWFLINDIGSTVIIKVCILVLLSAFLFFITRYIASSFSIIFSLEEYALIVVKTTGKKSNTLARIDLSDLLKLLSYEELEQEGLPIKYHYSMHYLKEHPSYLLVSFQEEKVLLELELDEFLKKLIQKQIEWNASFLAKENT